MKILYVSELSEMGGGETSLLNTMIEMNNSFKECEITLLCYTDGELIEKAKKNNINTIVYNFKNDIRKLKVISTFLRLRKILKKNKLDIVHSNEVIPAIILGILIKVNRLDCKSIWTCHGQWYKFNFVKKFLIKKYIDKIIAVSNAVRSNLLNYIDNSMIEKISLGINIDKFQNGEDSNIKKEFSITNNQLLISSIGRFQEIKGQKFAVEVCKLLSEEKIDYKFLMVGDSIFDNQKDEEYKKEVINLIKRYNLEKNIKLLGKREDIPDILKAVDILMIPSINESFGMVLIEAFAAECIVISNPCDGPKEIINNNENGILLEKRDPYLMRKEIIKLMNNNENIKSKIIQQLKSDKYNYDIKNMCEKYMAIYGE